MDRGADAAADAMTDTDTWALDALGVMAGVREVSRVGLALSEGGGRQHRFTSDDRSTTGGSTGGLAWCQIDAYEDVPLNSVVRTGQPVIGSLAELEQRYPAFAERQRRTPYLSFAAVPLCAAGQTLGGVVLYFDTPQAFPTIQRAELRGLGERLGQGLRRAQLGERRTWASLADEPVPTGARVAVHPVRADLAAVGEVRQAVSRELGEWGVEEDTADTAVLCLSELVTNALIHTRGGAEVRTVLEHGVLTTTVRDGGREAALPGGTATDPLRAQGRGLQIVDACADRWGSRLDSTGTTVWFVLET